MTNLFVMIFNLFQKNLLHGQLQQTDGLSNTTTFNAQVRKKSFNQKDYLPDNNQ